MASTVSADSGLSQLAGGSWRVDPSAGELEFRSRGMFGLVPVRGVFKEYSGSMTVDEQGAASGKLVIETASLDTENAKRDEHLRSGDFFAVEHFPQLTFEVTGITEEGPALKMTGTLCVRAATRLPLELPLELLPSGPERVELRTAISLERAAAGLGWSKGGMVKGRAHLSVHVVLERVASA